VSDRVGSRRVTGVIRARGSWESIIYIARMSVQRLRSLLEDAFPEAEDVDVLDRTGTGDHFLVTVQSGRFNDLGLVDQHRLVYQALAGPLEDGTIHELRIKTKGD
jgi:stress-induced morphogen